MVLEAIEQFLRDCNKVYSLTDERIAKSLRKVWSWHEIDKEVSPADIINAREFLESLLVKGYSFPRALHLAHLDIK